MEEENPGSKVNVPDQKPPKVRKKRAAVWKYYELSTDDMGKQIAHCKRCRSQFVAEGTDGTSHLTRHQERCTGQQDGAPPPIASSASPTIHVAASPESSKGSKAANWEEEATADLARMIGLHGYDPSFVEDSYFRSFVRRLNPDFQLPSRAAIEDICEGVCDEANKVLESELEHISGKVNLAIGTAETALGKVRYAACHFIDDDWNRRTIIFQVTVVVPEGIRPIPLSVVYYPDDLETFFMDINDHFIWERVFSLITTVGDYSGLLPYVRYETVDITYNLQIVADCFSELYYTNITHAMETYMASASKMATRQERAEIYSQFGLDHHLPYDKPWISFYISLQFLLKKKVPIDKSDETMCNVLGEIYRATNTISDPNHLTSNILLREIFKVRETLQSSVADCGRDEDYVEVLEKAKKDLDLEIDEQYRQWSIPLVLDPRYKLEYIEFIFRRAFSSEAEDYIAKITEDIQELFTSFSTDGAETTDAIHGKELTTTHQLEQAWGEHRQRSQVTKTELDRYLEDPLVIDTQDFDILNWWKLNSSKYPTIATIARVALAMPTSSKLSSEQMSQITSIIRGYSKEACL